MSELKETIDCLIKSFSSIDKNERTEAEKMLIELQKNLPNHINIIFSALKDENIVKAEIKLSCIVYIKNILRTRLELRLIQKDFISKILKSLIDLILTTTLSELCIKNIGPLLKDIFNYSEISKDSNIILEVVNVLVNFSKNLNNMTYIRGIFTIFENLCESFSVNQKNCENIFNNLLESSHLILLSVINNLHVIVPRNNIESFLYYTELCRIIFYFLSIIIVKSRKTFLNFNIFLNFFSEKLLPIAINLISSTIPDICPNYFIAWTGQKEFDNKVNSMKAQCFQFINAIIPYFGSKIENENFIKSVSILVDSSMSNLEYVLREKYSYLTNMSVDSKEFPDYKYELIINRILVFLTRLLCKEPIISFFSKYAQKFLISIIIPFLVATDVELKEMKENGENYTTFIDDCYNDRKSKRIKVLASDILVKMGKKYDGLCGTIVSYAIQLIDFCLKEEKTENIQNYPLLNNDYCQRMNSIPAEFKIETSILVLCVLSENVYKSEKNLLNLKCLVELHFTKMFILNQDIIKSRLLIFIGLFVDDLFNNQEEKFLFCLEYLLFNVLAYDTNKGLAYQAVDILNELITETEFIKPFENVLKNSLGKLIENIKTINISLFFDVLYDIVTNYDVDTFVAEIFRKVCSRIQQEFNNVTRLKLRNQSKKVSTVIINKCLNIVKALTEKQNYVLKYLNEMEICLEPLITLLKSSKIVSIDEDLIAITTNFIKTTKSIPRTAERMYLHLESYMKRVDNLLLDLFELINNYIIYGNIFILSDPININILINIYKSSFTDEGSYEKSPLLGSLLMQIWLQFAPSIPNNYVKEIILFSITQLKLVDTKIIGIPIEFFKFSSLICVLYSGFIHYPLITAECLIINNDFLNFIVSTETILTSRHYSAYQSKVIIIGICGLLSTNELYNDFNQYYLQLLNNMLTLLLKQKIEESKSLKIHLKKEIDCNFIESGSDDSEEEEEEHTEKSHNYKETIDQYVQSSKNLEEKEVKEIHDNLIGPSKFFDEYIIFQKCFDKIKISFKEIVESWINKLNLKERQHLNNIMQIKRINIINNNPQNPVITIPRKVVKIKRDGNVNVNIPDNNFNNTPSNDRNI